MERSRTKGVLNFKELLCGLWSGAGGRRRDRRVSEATRLRVRPQLLPSVAAPTVWRETPARPPARPHRSQTYRMQTSYNNIRVTAYGVYVHTVQ